MTSVNLTTAIDPAAKLGDEEWFDALWDIAEDEGFFEPLGPDHTATFIERGPVLLVTFETLESIRERTNTDVPLGWQMVEGTDWSHLCVISHGETWFRHRAVYEFFDKMVDDGLFDCYDRVIFYGAESCGYAACAYSVVAPGACVLALSPQATLDARETEWDERFVHMRRTSFSDRYGYAPDMIEAADRAFILYDPLIEEEAMHAALFHRTNVTRIRLPHMSGQIENFLRRMNLLKPLLEIAAKRDLRAGDLYAALRERHSYLPYLRALLQDLEEPYRPFLAALLCRAVLRRQNIPRFQREYMRASETLKRRHMKLPPVPHRLAPA